MEHTVTGTSETYAEKKLEESAALLDMFPDDASLTNAHTEPKEEKRESLFQKIKDLFIK